MLYFDIEATGTDPERDRIVELAVLPSESQDEPYVQRFNPGVPIPPAATAVHGITDGEVAGCPPFDMEAERVQRMFEGEVLCGFNIRKYDTLLLDAELRRAGQPGFDLARVQEVDLYRVWREMEPRSLASAVRRYLGREHEGAHSALGDARVLIPLLEAMREAHGLGREDLLRASRKPDEVDRAGRFRIRDGEVVFTFGVHEGELLREHPDYLDWMLRRDFPEDTKRAIRRLRNRDFRPEGTGGSA